VEKEDLFNRYWNPQRKTGLATHFCEMISLESQQNADISIFFKKKKKVRIFLHIFPYNSRLGTEKQTYL